MSERTCASCDQPFTPKREHGIYCSASCRSRARRTAQAAPTMPQARVRTGAEPSKLQDGGNGWPATVEVTYDAEVFYDDDPEELDPGRVHDEPIEPAPPVPAAVQVPPVIPPAVLDLADDIMRANDIKTPVGVQLAQVTVDQVQVPPSTAPSILACSFHESGPSSSCVWCRQIQIARALTA